MILSVIYWFVCFPTKCVGVRGLLLGSTFRLHLQVIRELLTLWHVVRNGTESTSTSLAVCQWCTLIPPFSSKGDTSVLRHRYGHGKALDYKQ